MKRRRRRRRKQMKLLQWFKSLKPVNKVLLILGIVLLCLLVAAVIYVASIFGRIDRQEIKEGEIIINELDESVGVGYTNFVLFGGDSRSGEVDRYLNTDSIIIVSLNNETKEVKLVSVYRDTLLDLTNGKIRKCNSAYASGGPTRAINMLNMNLDLNIQKYVTVDFTAVVDLVDMLGGIEVDVSSAEMKATNRYIKETARVSGKKANYLTRSGVQLLDGVQATTYARIRKGVGDDYARTARQRLIIQKVVEKAMKSDFSTINKIINTLLDRISTNFTDAEILGYAKDFTKYKIGETSGFPFKKGSGSIPGRGSSVFPITLKSNVSELHKFLYGTEDYQPSAKVVEISGEIAYIVGNRKPDKDSNTSSGNGSGTGDTTTDPSTGDGTTPGTGDGTTPGTGDGTTPGTGDGTTPGTGDGTTPGTGDTTTPGTGDGTTPGTGDTTTPGTGDTTTPGTGDTTTPGTGDTTTPGTGDTTTPGTGDTTPSGSGGGTETGAGNNG